MRILKIQRRMLLGGLDLISSDPALLWAWLSCGTRKGNWRINYKNMWVKQNVNLKYNPLPYFHYYPHTRIYVESNRPTDTESYQNENKHNEPRKQITVAISIRKHRHKGKGRCNQTRYSITRKFYTTDRKFCSTPNQ